MYLGANSAFRLYMFLTGYVSALRDMDGALQEGQTLAEIQSYVMRQKEITTSRNWATILEFTCGEGQPALDAFWQIWDQYLEEQKTSSRLQQGETSSS